MSETLEAQAQKLVVSYLTERDDTYCWYATLNERKTTGRQGKRWNALGRRTGVWDLAIDQRTKTGRIGLKIEMKAPLDALGKPQGEMSAAQVEWGERYERAGWATAGPCHGAKAAMDAIDHHYGVSPRTKLLRETILASNPGAA